MCVSVACPKGSLFLQYGAGVKQLMECPKNMVGRVIGKGGETIKLLQKTFTVNIQINQQVEPMKISIQGAPGAVQTALNAIQDIIAGGNPFANGPGGGPVGLGGAGSEFFLSLHRHPACMAPFPSC